MEQDSDSLPHEQTSLPQNQQFPLAALQADFPTTLGGGGGVPPKPLEVNFRRGGGAAMGQGKNTTTTFEIKNLAHVS